MEIRPVPVFGRGDGIPAGLLRNLSRCHSEPAKIARGAGSDRGFEAFFRQDSGQKIGHSKVTAGVWGSFATLRMTGDRASQLDVMKWNSIVDGTSNVAGITGFGRHYKRAARYSRPPFCLFSLCLQRCLTALRLTAHLLTALCLTALWLTALWLTAPRV